MNFHRTLLTVGILALASACSDGKDGKGKIPGMPSFANPPPMGGSLSAGAEAIARSNSAIHDASQFSSKRLANTPGASDVQSAAKEAPGELPFPVGAAPNSFPDLVGKLTPPSAESAGGSGGSGGSAGAGGLPVQTGDITTAENHGGREQDPYFAGGAAGVNETIFSGATAGGVGSAGSSKTNALAAVQGLFGAMTGDSRGGTNGPGAVGSGDVDLTGLRGPGSTGTVLLSTDPGDYFSRIDTSRSLFQIVERRYRQTSDSWAAAQIK